MTPAIDFPNCGLGHDGRDAGLGPNDQMTLLTGDAIGLEPEDSFTALNEDAENHIDDVTDRNEEYEGNPSCQYYFLLTYV